MLARFLKATIEGNYLALADAQRAKDVLAPRLKISDPKILDITYNDFKALTPPNTEPSRQGAENILAQFPGGSRKVEDYVDSEPARRAAAARATSRRCSRSTGAS